MLGWLKGLANWVLRLFNLAGRVSTSPLLWLSHNWLKLLIFFLVLGVVVDRLIWLIRWRPYWVWFRKERVIVNDDRFFSKADLDKAGEWEGDLANNWDEHDYVVASTVVRRQNGSRSRDKSWEGGRQGGPAPRRRSEGTRVERHVDRSRQAASRQKEAADRARARGERPQEERAREKRPQGADDSFFGVDLRNRDVSDSYEDEVFNVSNLPVFDEFSDQDRAE